MDWLDTPAHEFLPEWSESERKDITIRHLLTYTSGLRDAGYSRDYLDGVAYGLETVLNYRPGEKFQYKNNDNTILAEIVKRESGQSFDEYIRQNILDPMEINNVSWEKDRAGNIYAFRGLQMTAGDLAKVGQLILQDGKWNGHQIIDSTFAKESVTPQLKDAPMGFNWVLKKENEKVLAYFHSGLPANHLVIYPEKQLVGVRLIDQFPGIDMESDGFGEFNEMVKKLID